MIQECALECSFYSLDTSLTTTHCVPERYLFSVKELILEYPPGKVRSSSVLCFGTEFLPRVLIQAKRCVSGTPW